MNRKLTKVAGAGYWKLIFLVAISIGMMACAFSVPDIGNSGQPNNNPFFSQQPTNGQTSNNNSPAFVPNTGNRGPVTIGNLAQPPTTAPANLAQLYNQVNPGTVSIDVQITQGGQQGEAAGSGFIITDNGYIVTNNHVVEGASQVYVTFFNGIILPAQVVGVDPNSDLAVIKVDKLPADTKPLPMGDSSKVNVGEFVVALGNPFALGTSMSYGIVSALGRVIPSLTDYTIPQAIQTDAAINPGNSGGPLINMNGEVIGIDAQIQTGSSGGGNVGVGFAIPINILKLEYQELIQKGTFNWPYLGVSGGNITPMDAQQIGVDPNQRGAYIATVTSGGPSANAGLRQGDIVIKADNQTINTFDDLLTYIAFKRPGDKVALTVIRNGSQQQVTVTLGTRPQTPASNNGNQ